AMQRDAIAGDREGRARMLGGSEIVAGAEGAAGAADDQHARRGLGLESVHRGLELAQQLLRQRVELLGTIERKPKDPLLDLFVDQRLVFGHRAALRSNVPPRET